MTTRIFFKLLAAFVLVIGVATLTLDLSVRRAWEGSLERELESRRCPFGPSTRGRRRRHAVERRVDLDRVEMLGVERQLVELAAAPPARSDGIEDAVPGALAGRVAPAGGADFNQCSWGPTPPC